MTGYARNPTLRLFRDRDLIDELIERGFVVEAWSTTRISDIETAITRFDWRKELDRTNVLQLVECEPFKANLLRLETVDDNATTITHTILILKATEDTRELPSRR